MRLHRFENVRLENVAVPPIFVQSQHFQCLAVLEAIADDPADDAVRGAEGDSPFRQIVRDVRRAGEIFRRGFFHALYVRSDLFQHLRIDRKAVFDRLFRVEKALLILLQVLVVGEGDALDRRQKRREMPVDSARFAAYQLADVGVFLLGA